MSEQPSILLATDFSSFSKEAACYAAKLALCFNMSLILLHVVHDPACSPGYYLNKHSKKRLKKMSDVAHEMMQDFINELHHDSVDFAALQTLDDKTEEALIKPMLINGLPVPRILQVIQKIMPRMVVMGSHGHNPLTQLLLGSKAVQILRLSPVSVTIVKQGHPLKDPIINANIP